MVYHKYIVHEKHAVTGFLIRELTFGFENHCLFHLVSLKMCSFRTAFSHCFVHFSISFTAERVCTSLSLAPSDNCDNSLMIQKSRSQIQNSRSSTPAWEQLWSSFTDHAEESKHQAQFEEAQSLKFWWKVCLGQWRRGSQQGPWGRPA